MALNHEFYFRKNKKILRFLEKNIFYFYIYEIWIIILEISLPVIKTL